MVVHHSSGGRRTEIAAECGGTVKIREMWKWYGAHVESSCGATN
jgi:hypothetical protein